MKDEVLRKIGRNMILFQQIEGLLKLLLGNSHVQGTASDLMVYQGQRMEEMKKQMMGPLIKQYIEEILSESWMSFRSRSSLIACFMRHKAETSNWW